MSADEDEAPDADAAPEVTSEAEDQQTPGPDKEADSSEDSAETDAAEAKPDDAESEDAADAKPDDAESEDAADAKPDDDEASAADESDHGGDAKPDADEAAPDDAPAGAAADDDAAADETSADEPAKSAEPEVPKPARPEDAYPLADERTLKRAGLGFVLLVAVASLLFLWFFNVAFKSITELDSAGTSEGSEPAPSASNPEQPSESSDPSLAGFDDTRTRIEVTWLHDLDAAKALATAQNRPLLVYFEASLAPNAIAARDIAFGGPEARALASGFVTVDVDLAAANDATRATAQQLGVTSVPHLIMLRPDLSPLSEGVTTLDPPSVRQAMQAALHAFPQ